MQVKLNQQVLKPLIIFLLALVLTYVLTSLKSPSKQSFFKDQRHMTISNVEPDNVI